MCDCNKSDKVHECNGEGGCGNAPPVGDFMGPLVCDCGPWVKPWGDDEDREHVAIDYEELAEAIVAHPGFSQILAVVITACMAER